MTEKTKKYLSDILIAIALIRDFTVDISDFNIYDNDRKTQSAVERQLVIIGEALNKLKSIESEITIENDKQIIGLFWAEQSAPRILQIGQQTVACHVSKRDQSLLTALAHHTQDTFVQRNVQGFEFDQF